MVTSSDTRQVLKLQALQLQKAYICNNLLSKKTSSEIRISYTLILQKRMQQLVTKIIGPRQNLEVGYLLLFKFEENTSLRMNHTPEPQPPITSNKVGQWVELRLKLVSRTAEIQRRLWCDIKWMSSEDATSHDSDTFIGIWNRAVVIISQKMNFVG